MRGEEVTDPRVMDTTYLSPTRRGLPPEAAAGEATDFRDLEESAADSQPYAHVLQHLRGGVLRAFRTGRGCAGEAGGRAIVGAGRRGAFVHRAAPSRLAATGRRTQGERPQRLPAQDELLAGQSHRRSPGAEPTAEGEGACGP